MTSPATASMASHDDGDGSTAVVRDSAGFLRALSFVEEKVAFFSSLAHTSRFSRREQQQQQQEEEVEEEQSTSSSPDDDIGDNDDDDSVESEFKNNNSLPEYMIQSSQPPATMMTDDDDGEKPTSSKSTVVGSSTDSFSHSFQNQSTMLESDSDNDSSHYEDLMEAKEKEEKSEDPKGRGWSGCLRKFLIAMIIPILIIIGVASGSTKKAKSDQNQLENDENSSATTVAPFHPKNPTPSPPTLSPRPTTRPSGCPSNSPSTQPSSNTSDFLTNLTTNPSNLPSASPSHPPARSFRPSGCPSEEPSMNPTISVQPTLRPATFFPGNLTRFEVGLLLSEGLRARIIARTGEHVEYADGNVSDIVFHGRPDFGATFPDTRWGESDFFGVRQPANPDGWVYTSNSEMEEEGEGGVGAFTFDSDGNVIDYKMVLQGTTMNCGGGRTPWNTWVSCEELESEGLIYQVDPFGERPAEPMTIGMELGRWESFTYDVRNRDVPRFFASEDHNKGAVRRFTPDIATWDTPWEMLHASGTVDYLIVYPNENLTGGTFNWTNDREEARNNARTYYPQSEGIDVYREELYLVCKRIKQIFTFNLDTMTYFNQSTVTGLFDGKPDQMQRIVGHSDDLLYFSEEGGEDAGVHARDENSNFYTILESPEYRDETTGLAFSPDGMHMYVAYQSNGLLFDVWREDGLPFQARTLNVKYHQTDQL